MKIATTQSERLALIKEIAQRKKLMSKIKSESNLVIGKAKASSKPARHFHGCSRRCFKKTQIITLTQANMLHNTTAKHSMKPTKFDSHFANGDWD